MPVYEYLRCWTSGCFSGAPEIVSVDVTDQKSENSGQDCGHGGDLDGSIMFNTRRHQDHHHRQREKRDHCQKFYQNLNSD